MATQSSIQQTLHLLLPTASTLPPALTNLAASLLAQSRIKATSLKPEEEIARTFACCHIACERLKNKHGLEVGRAGPPCGPRIYRRLYGFLESKLLDVSGTPSGRKTGGREEVGQHRGTPRSGRSDVKIVGDGAKGAGTARTPGSLGKRTRGVTSRAEAVELPRFVMPLIRHMCADLDMAEAATHVYAGVESVYRNVQSRVEEEVILESSPSKRRKGNEGESMHELPTETQVPALVAAVYFHTTSVMCEALDATDESRQLEITDAVRGYFKKQKAPLASMDFNGLEDDFGGYLRVGKTQWQSMEWFQNLPGSEVMEKGVSQGNHQDQEAGPLITRTGSAKTPLRRKEKHARRPVSGDETEDLGAAGLLPGLGTMFQAAVDWLSDERRADLAAWKKEMRKAIAIAEQTV